MVILGWIPLSGAAPDPILVDYFYEPGCSECEKIQTQILPALEVEFAGHYVLVKHDTVLSIKLPSYAVPELNLSKTASIIAL